jgi:predicted DNA binding CopG/RHH family protein
MVAPTKSKRMCIALPPELIAALRSRKVHSGIPMSEYLRRALRLSLFADQRTVEMRSDDIRPE